MIRLILYLFLSKLCLGETVIELAGVKFNIESNETPISEGGGSYQSDQLDELGDPIWKDYEYWCSERIYICRIANGLIVNQFYYPLPKDIKIKQVNIKLQDTEVVLSSRGLRLNERHLVNKKDTPLGFGEIEGVFTISNSGKTLKLHIIGFLAAAGASDIKDGDNNNIGSAIISSGNVILCIKNNNISLWGANLGACNESLYVNQDTKTIVIDGKKKKSFSDYGIE